jgi:hypothetical protein
MGYDRAVRRLVLALVVLASGCGRIGFGTGTGGDGGADDGSAVPDATTACVADGFCPPSCVGRDPDCETTCGDGTCIGNAGELCTTCTADCRTTMDVCGNGTCGASETGATCYSDCGPSPWAWSQDEAELLAAINQARTGGTSCAGMPATTAPALTIDADLARAARDLTWEEAHLGTITFNRCDGQPLVAFLGMANAASSRIAAGQTTTQQRISDLIASDCSTVMDPARTRVGIGVADDIAAVYVVLLR